MPHLKVLWLDYKQILYTWHKGSLRMRRRGGVITLIWDHRPRSMSHKYSNSNSSEKAQHVYKSFFLVKQFLFTLKSNLANNINGKKTTSILVAISNTIRTKLPCILQKVFKTNDFFYSKFSPGGPYSMMWLTTCTIRESPPGYGRKFLSWFRGLCHKKSKFNISALFLLSGRLF